MSKRWKIILAIVAGVVVLSLTGTAIAFAADGTSQPSTSTSNPLLAQVAQLIGKTEQQLTDALKQARQQAASEAIDNALDNAAKNSVITQADETAIKVWLAQQPDPTNKDAMKTWWSQRPQISNPKVYNRLLGAHALVMRFGYGFALRLTFSTPVLQKTATILGIDEQTLVNAFKQAAQELQGQRLQTALNNAVKNGKLTQDEANQIQTWWSQRPAALDKLAPGFGLGRFGRLGPQAPQQPTTQTTTQ
jgi:hypothetical protein